MEKIKRTLTQLQCQYLEAIGFDMPFDFTSVKDGRPLYAPLDIPDLLVLLPDSIEFQGETWHLNMSHEDIDDSDKPIWRVAFWNSRWDDNHWRCESPELIDALFTLVVMLKELGFI